MIVAYFLSDWPPGRDCQAWNGKEIFNFMRFLLDSECELSIGEDPIDDDLGTEELLVVRCVGYFSHLNNPSFLSEVQ